MKRAEQNYTAKVFIIRKDPNKITAPKAKKSKQKEEILHQHHNMDSSCKQPHRSISLTCWKQYDTVNKISISSGSWILISQGESTLTMKRARSNSAGPRPRPCRGATTNKRGRGRGRGAATNISSSSSQMQVDSAGVGESTTSGSSSSVGGSQTSIAYVPQEDFTSDEEELSQLTEEEYLARLKANERELSMLPAAQKEEEERQLAMAIMVSLEPELEQGIVSQLSFWQSEPTAYASSSSTPSRQGQARVSQSLSTTQPAQTKGSSSRPECEYCYDAPIGATCDPCGHVACFNCWVKIQDFDNKCPCCRVVIKKIIKLYL